MQQLMPLREASSETMTTSSSTGRGASTAVIPVAPILFALAGTALFLSPTTQAWGKTAWLVGLVVTGSPVVWRTLRNVVRGHFATDVVAMLAIVAAAALQQPLAGLIVVVMQTGGEALERFAEGRASQAVRQLEQDAPRIAHRVLGGATDDVVVDEVRIDDEILVRPGEMVPCDGLITTGRSHIDTSRLTGEPLPIEVDPGSRVLSGSLNVEGPLVVRATALSRESQYARIVELVRSAQASKAPLQRLADRYAVWFTPLTLAVCAVTWLVSGDATRALAVLVVATPCPLILATPIAIIGGINRAARRQIIVRTGGALEALAAVRVAVFDKTGTLTIGRPAVSRVTAMPPLDERGLLRLAGAVEQHSGHSLARSVVLAADDDGPLPTPTEVVEEAGRGITAKVMEHAVSVGSREYALERMARAGPDQHMANGGGLQAYVVVNGALAGTIEFADEVRAGTAEVLADLRRLGLQRILLLSGDHEPNVRKVADALEIDEARGDLLPGEKVARVAELSARAGGVMMVGDGTNDAPALSRASVGVALAGHGGGITAEAADVVILVDDLARVSEAVRISRRTMRIARQSIWVGLSLSGVAMAFAAVGIIPPVVGALLQEGIDVAVILNALRASFPGD
jgi:heavy metal translocating P-type ATPase